MTVNGHRASFWGYKKILKFDRGDGCMFCKYTEND